MASRYGSLPGIARHYGFTGLGVLGSVIRATTATGAHGPGYLYNDWRPGDDNKEFWGPVETPPSAGVFFPREDGSFDLTGAPDGTYSFVYQLKVAGIAIGQPVTATITIGAQIPTNNTAPSITGSAVQGQTLTASDGTWSNTPTGFAYRWLRGPTAITGATAKTYVPPAADVGSQLRVGVTATNSAGVSSAEALSAQTAVVTAAVDTERPTLTGAITVGVVTATSIQISWPPGADNVGVTGYETSTDGGVVWTDRGVVLTYNCTGLTPGASYTLRVRNKDAAGNTSTPVLSVTQSTNPLAVVTTTITTEAFRDYDGGLLPLTLIPNVMVVNPATRDVVLSLGNMMTAADATLAITSSAPVAGTLYLVFAFSATGASRGAKIYMAV